MLEKGMVVPVYADPYTRIQQEGHARLEERDPDESKHDDYVEYWLVRFQDQATQKFTHRAVWRFIGKCGEGS